MRVVSVTRLVRNSYSINVSSLSSFSLIKFVDRRQLV